MSQESSVNQRRIIIGLSICVVLLAMIAVVAVVRSMGEHDNQSPEHNPGGPPLIACPSCGRQISSVANACPHCGLTGAGFEKWQNEQKEAERSRREAKEAEAAAVRNLEEQHAESERLKAQLAQWEKEKEARLAEKRAARIANKDAIEAMRVKMIAIAKRLAANLPASSKTLEDQDDWGHFIWYSEVHHTITSMGPDGIDGGEEPDDVVVEIPKSK